MKLHNTAMILALALFITIVISVRASWYIDSSVAASHLGGLRQMGPFATKEQALAVIGANPNMGLRLMPNGTDDVSAGGLTSGSDNDGQQALEEQQRQEQQEAVERQQAIEEQRRKDREEAARKQKEEAARRQAEFEKTKQDALSSMKGIATGSEFGGLKGISTDVGPELKGLGPTKANDQLKGIDSQPAQPVVTDSMVVDARNVPTGLPKDVEDSIPHTPAGDRVRKGFEAIQTHDWKVALAWFQDALNHEPGDPGLQRLVDLAQFTLNWRIQHHMLAFENPEPATKAANAPAGAGGMSDEQAAKVMSSLDKALTDKMNEDLNRALNDFYRNYVPKHPEIFNPPSSSSPKPTSPILPQPYQDSKNPLNWNWKAFFDSFKPQPGPLIPKAVGAVRG